MSNTAEKVYSTMAEKVAAYEDFFKSDDNVLVVVGKGGSGKSAAFQKLTRRGMVHLVSSEIDATTLPPLNIKEDDDDAVSRDRMIYHLFDTDEDIAQALKKKYNARVVRFERGTEGLEATKKEYVDFADMLESFYEWFHDGSVRKNGLLNAVELRKGIQGLLDAFDAAPRVSLTA